jgi:hypothetical protein
MDPDTKLVVVAGLGAAMIVYFVAPEAVGKAIDAASTAVERAAGLAEKVIDFSSDVAETAIDGAKKIAKETKRAIENTVDVGIGTPLQFEGCREGFRNDGLTCMKDGGIRTYECGRLKGAFGEDWGPKYCTDTWAPESYSQRLVCKGGRQNVDSLCYTPCPSGSRRVPGMPYLCRY